MKISKKRNLMRTIVCLAIMVLLVGCSALDLDDNSRAVDIGVEKAFGSLPTDVLTVTEYRQLHAARGHYEGFAARWGGERILSGEDIKAFREGYAVLKLHHATIVNIVERHWDALPPPMQTHLTRLQGEILQLNESVEATVALNELVIDTKKAVKLAILLAKMLI